MNMKLFRFIVLKYTRLYTILYLCQKGVCKKRVKWHVGWPNDCAQALGTNNYVCLSCSSCAISAQVIELHTDRILSLVQWYSNVFFLGDNSMLLLALTWPYIYLVSSSSTTRFQQCMNYWGKLYCENHLST